MPIVKISNNHPKPTLTLSRPTPVSEAGGNSAFPLSSETQLEPIQLKVTRKVKNSPLLSVQKFIDNYIIYQATDRALTPESLWSKYQLDPAHSLIIKEHELTGIKFQRIAEPILETLKNHQVLVCPQNYSHSAVSLSSILNEKTPRKI